MLAQITSRRARIAAMQMRMALHMCTILGPLWQMGYSFRQ